MKQLIRLSFFTLLFLIILIKNCTLSYADLNSELQPSLKNMFEKNLCIDAYDININVNKDGSLDVTETINAVFYTENAKLIRNIPLVYNKLYKKTSYSGYAKISNIKINSEYTKDYKANMNNNDALMLTISKPNNTSTGSNTLIISYKYELLSNSLDVIDTLYFNLIDYTSPYYIGNISFSIELPKKFNKKDFIFSNRTSTNANENITYNIKNNTIKGTYKNILSPNTGLDFDLKLGKNYFTKKNNLYIILDLLILILPIISLIIVTITWNNNNKIINTTESLGYYPPKGFNNTEVGLMFKGKTSAHDIAALIIQLANKGYIAIVNDDTAKRHYSFKILKPYTGKNIIEQKLYDGLVHYADKESHLRISDLKNNFFDILDDINYELENGQLKSNMYLENYNSQIFNYICMVLSLISIYLIPAIFGLKTYGIIPALIAVAVISIILLPVKLFIRNKWIQAILNILIIGIGYLIAINVVNIPYGMIYRANPLYHFIIPIALLATILLGIIFAYSSKRNIFGTTMLKQLNIFKENLIKADKIDLICVLKEDPNYFYKILPYAYTLDFNEIWLDKFKNIDIKQPSWFITNSVFDIETFGNGLNRTINYTAEAITTVPKSLSSKKIFSN